MIKQTSSYLVKADTLKEAQERYLNKTFVIHLSKDHVVAVKVVRVELYGGYVLPFARLVRTVRADKSNKTRWAKNGEYVHAGRLEDEKIGGTI